METKRQMLHRAVNLVTLGISATTLSVRMRINNNYWKVISFFNNLPAVGVKEDVAHASACQDFTPLCLDLDHTSEFKEKQAGVISSAY